MLLLADAEAAGLVVSATHVTIILVTVVTAAVAVSGWLLHVQAKWYDEREQRVKLEGRVDVIENERVEIKTTLKEITGALEDIRLTMNTIATEQGARLTKRPSLQ